MKDNMYLFTKAECETSVYVSEDGFVSFSYSEFPEGTSEEIKIEFFKQASAHALSLDKRIRNMERGDHGA